MKIYVAGKWKEASYVQEVMDMLKLKGHEITCDWTGHVHPEKSKEYAIEDLEGVKNCDIVFALMPDPTTFYKGAWIEIGMGLALNKKIIVVGEEVSSVFLGHPNISLYRTKELKEAIYMLEIILKE